MKSCLETDKVLFIGNSKNLIELAKSIRGISQFSVGDVVCLDNIILRVSDEITHFMHEKNTIEMPNHAWSIFASKILEVVDGIEDSPFYFNNCGYLYPRLTFDIGIELKD